MLKWFLILTIFSIALASDCYRHCPDNEVFSKCGNCRKTCNIREIDKDCVCSPGCICNFEFLRNSHGVCMPKGECDSPCNGDLGKVYDPCGNSCPKTCANFNKSDWECKAVCSEEGACRCIDGLVEHHGECINPQNCEKVCPENEAYSECRANEYQNTCDDPNRSITTPNQHCESGCVCRFNYVRDHNGVCIPQEYCGVDCDGDPNSYLERCATDCSNKACSQLEDEKFGCRATGICSNRVECACKPGYYRHNGKCIPKGQCPTCDGANEAWLRRSDDLRCSNINATILKEHGEEGCFCKLGYARDCYGKCVLLKDCNQKSCDGDLYAYYEQCDISCQKTCTYRQGKPCVKGVCAKFGECVCKQNYVKHDNGKCVLPEHCNYCQKSFIPPTPPPCHFPIPAYPTLPPLPNIPIPTHCGENEQYESFPAGKWEPVDQTCEMYFKGIQRNYLGPHGEPGCRCLPAYVRNSQGVCVIPQNCCEDPNSHFIAGPNTCPGGTCKNPEFLPCDNPWQPFGCQCNFGYLKISDWNPTCVEVKECCNYI